MPVEYPFSLSDDSRLVFETPASHSHFFGYHDKSPFDASGNRMLSHRVPFDGRTVQAEDVAEVGYWDLDEEEFVELGKSRAFNWQQGSMLQWLPPGYDNRIIYNDRGEDSFKSILVNVESGRERVIDEPIYAIHPSGEFALTVNFERMAFCHPTYSYKGIRNEKWDTPFHEDDGIYKVDLNTGEKTQIVKTSEICSVEAKPIFLERDNWLEHVRWNPSGTRFAFLHRWRVEDGRFRTRLFTANPDGSELFMFPDTGLYSHMDWKNDREFTVWGARPSSYQKTERVVRETPFLNAIARPTYRLLKDRIVGSRMDELLPQRAFLEFRDQSEDYKPFALECLTNDGHPSWSEDERWFLTDTYPLDEDFQHLLLYDDERGELNELGRFHSKAAYEDYKCDLHPRWDRGDEQIAVDSAHRERRQMVVVEQSITSK